MIREFPRFTLGRIAGALTLVSVLAIVVVPSLIVSPKALAQTYVSFPPGGGMNPQAGVTIKGTFVYGTAALGGLGGGAVYQAMRVGNIWSAVDLYDFSSVPSTPEARVVFGPDSHLYGATAGNDNFDLGIVFNLVPNPTICKTARCNWNVTELHQFQGFPSDGAHPGHGDLIWDQHGNIYGTTTIGGTKELGVVYEMMPPVPPLKTWTESVIWNFTGPDGENPQNAVVFDSNGNLLGTAKQGGANGFGTVFKLTLSGNTWTETNVYDFQGGSDGKSPIAGLMIDGSGNIYGATSDGGSGGGGTVFELTLSGNTYIFKLLYSFSGQLGNNCGPWATLSMDAGSNLYGTTFCDGAHDSGNVFKLSNNGNNWIYSSVADFPVVPGDGVFPISNVSFDANGNLWGTASGCERSCHGVVWEITP